MKTQPSKLTTLLYILPLICLSSGAFVARHDMTSAQYQAEFTKQSNAGYRLVDVNGYNKNDQARYAGLWYSDTSGPGWTARHGLNEAQYQTAVTDLSEDGYRPHRISAFEIDGTPYFAVIFHKPAGAWVARHDMTSSGYQTEYNDWTSKGYRLIEICGYTKNGATRYAAVWEKSNGLAYIARHGLSASAYQTEFNTHTRNGYTPVRVSAFEVSGADYYAAIWVKNGQSYYAKHRLTEYNYQAEFDNGLYMGRVPRQVCGYSSGSSVRFAAIWSYGSLKTEDLTHIDSKVKEYMDASNVPGLTIGVMKDERLVWAKGYGVEDESNGNMVSPYSMFRIASVSKPITAAAIMRLTETTNLKLTDKVFGAGSILGDFCVNNGDCIDESDLEDITVQHCLEHTTGWTQDAVWQQYQLSNNDIIKWAVKNYAQSSTPGSNYQYMNFDYFLLGRIIEKKSGQTYENYVKSAILSKVGVTDMYIGADTKASRGPHEVVYYPDGNGDPYGLKLRRMDANGGWVGRPISLLKFFAGIDKLSSRTDVLKGTTIDTMRTVSTAMGAGNYAKGLMVNGNWWMHNGCMSGTLATLVHFANGISIAMAVNTRPQNDECQWDGMYPLADDIQSAGIDWPSHNLF